MTNACFPTVRTFIIMGAITALSACASNTVKDTLGLNRSAPDEFRVVSRPPLSVPPQFNLRPPATANDAPAMAPSSKQAEALMTGNKIDSTNPGDTFSLKPVASTAPATAIKPAGVTGGNAAESAFLQNAGAGKADPNVRTELRKHQDEVQEVKEDCSWWEIGCSASTEKKEPLVDAQKEKDRIKQDQKAGQPVTTGETPEVKSKDTGLLGSVFGY